MPSLTSIDGIGRAQASKLAKMGIKTAATLLEAGKMPSDRRRIAEKLGVSAYDVLQWLIYADFFRIRGMKEEYVHLFQKAGITTVQELAFYGPQDLFDLLTAAGSTNGKPLNPPALSTVENWVLQAVGLSSIIWFEGMHCLGIGQ